ncbi:PAS domain S-box-containing protein [Constrictibacter sp. MBR-5]|jgi:PAS domain S-box-containing protein|uniref:hybrid sensor histidine kinase/response regulator n=1 Tax=Constrictibacter sp. MBR-5 TaxID=3156467 RepID=UPI00339305E0
MGLFRGGYSGWSSDRRTAEQQLRESESRLRAVVETAVDGVILIDAFGLVEMFNPACETLFGYRADEVLGQNVKMLMPQPYEAEHDVYLRRYRHTGERRIIGIGREVAGQRKDGTVFPMELSVGEAQRDGRPVFAGIIRDISQRKQAEQSLRESEGRLRALVETAVDGVILIDAVGTVQMFNPACETLFGYRAEEVVDRNVRMLMPEPYQSEHDRYLEQYREDGVRRIIGIGREVSARRKDGSIFPMELSVGEATRGDQPVFVGIIRDISARKEAETAREQLQQAQKMEAIGQLTGGIAHDFNNLMAVMLGNLELVLDRLDPADASTDLIRTAIHSVERGAQLTQRLLAFSRTQTLKPRQIDVNQLITGMMPLVRLSVGEAIDIRMDLEAEIWTTMIDAAQLENALLNLANNSRDAMAGKGRLTISTANVAISADDLVDEGAAPGAYVRVTVRDDGAGMDAAVLAHVFEPFFTTKEVGHGSGLGLSMVYGFVKQSNGFVAIDSRVGGGTRVDLFLPRVTDPALSDRRAEEGPAPRSTARSWNILLVEDDAALRQLARRILESLGHSVRGACDGPEALRLLREDPRVDLLFTDIILPGGQNGVDIAQAAREMLPDLKVLFTSGYLETRDRGAELSPDEELITKPARRRDIEAAIQRVMNGSR